MELIFASNNEHKIREWKALLPSNIQIKTLKEAGIDIDIPEPHQTLEENAAEKARTIYKLTGKNCFSEDTGLEVKALNGEPGVHSARYAGDEKSFQKNIDKLLANLSGAADRSARFRAVICLIIDGKEHFFEGLCPGHILESSRGVEGFGYDPVFVPQHQQKSFAEMSLEEKNKYNHRRDAAGKLVAFLKQMS
ncbi:MAG: RdgB/HAM1 family non-canonical purine NTP pyrophosphatase [Flavisolibacter sp.]